MRRAHKIFALTAVGCLVICALGVAQTSSSSGRWFPRLGEIFGGSKNAEAAEKKTKAAAAKASAPKPSPTNEPALLPLIDQAAPVNVPPAVVVEEKSSRLMEIVVELALLSDPATFPYLLEARVEGQQLKVQGHVASKAVREHALKLVRLNCPLTVVDAMKEHSGSAPPKLARPDPRTLENSATTVLKQSFPGDDKNFEVKCAADGKAEVTGFVRSFEEKLKVSQALRRIHGCACVINRVHVLADDGPTPVAKPGPSKGKTVKTSEAPTPRYGPRIDTAPDALLPALDRPTEQPVKLATAIKDGAASKKPATEKQPILPTGWANVKLPARGDAKTNSATGKQQEALSTAEWRRTGGAKEAKDTSKPTASPAPQAEIQQTRFNTATPTAVVPTPASTAPVPFPTGASVSQERASPPVSSAKQERALPPVSKSKQERAPQQLPPSTPPAPASRFKQLVEIACGASVRDVTVEVISPTDLLVQFRVKDEVDARQIARRVLSLPELDRYRVEVRVKVPQ